MSQESEKIEQLSQQLTAANARVLKLEGSNRALAEQNIRLQTLVAELDAEKLARATRKRVR